jgi:hypothetical protein
MFNATSCMSECARRQQAKGTLSFVTDTSNTSNSEPMEAACAAVAGWLLVGAGCAAAEANLGTAGMAVGTALAK